MKRMTKKERELKEMDEIDAMLDDIDAYWKGLDGEASMSFSSEAWRMIHIGMPYAKRAKPPTDLENG